MKEVIDIIAIILFIIVLFIVIAGFNRQMIEKNKERAKIAKEREDKIKANKVNKEEK
ncbi:MAG: hypothetical protein ACO29X_06335 [Arcobacteraceae bacterium]|jgi:hypothetical protein